MKHRYYLDTEKGIRKENQDNAGVFINRDGHAIAVLADGMGGHIGGKLASSMTIRIIEKLFKDFDVSNRTDREIKSWSISAVKAVKKEMKIYTAANPDVDDMGTTLVFVIFGDRKLYVTNIGDSRAYKVEGKKVRQITKDQNYTNSIKDPRERAKIELTIVGEYLISSLGPRKETQVDFFDMPIDLVDHIVLTCDGIHKFIPEPKFNKILSSSSNDEQLINKLIKSAKKHYSSDNMTAISIKSYINEGDI